MSRIGTFGKLRFAVSDKEVLTFQKMKRQVSADWSTIERIGKKPLAVFSGPELQSIGFTIILDASLGVPPRQMLDTLEQMVESGNAQYLIIGKERVGKHRWVITKSSETWNTILVKGELYRASVDLSLQEYV